MSDPNEMLSLEEAKIRARKGADELEHAINKVDRTPGKRDEERHSKLTSLFMSFLAEKYGIVPSEDAQSEIDRE